MAEAKTKPTKARVKDFLAEIANENRRQDCQVIVKLMSKVTGAKPEMWGPSIIGCGRYLQIRERPRKRMDADGVLTKKE